MPRIVWVNPSAPRSNYVTTIPNDPNVPAGYVLTNTSDGSWQGVDGVHDQDLQQYVGGVNSGGYPPYAGDPATAGNSSPNGILGGGNV